MATKKERNKIARHIKGRLDNYQWGLTANADRWAPQHNVDLDSARMSALLLARDAITQLIRLEGHDATNYTCAGAGIKCTCEDSVTPS